MEFPGSFEVWVQWLTYSPLVICSIVGSTITVAKWLQLRQAFVPPDVVIGDVVRLLGSEHPQGVVTRLSVEPARGVRMVHAAVAASDLPRDALREQVALSGRSIGEELDRGLGTLALLASLGPLFGLLGTVVGIVLVFDRLAAGGGATPADLAGGIGTALYTTILGLVVGILALVCHRYLSGQADRILSDLEVFGARLVNALNGTRS